jgi:hypothetical protein
MVRGPGSHRRRSLVLCATARLPSERCCGVPRCRTRTRASLLRNDRRCVLGRVRPASARTAQTSRRHLSWCAHARPSPLMFLNAARRGGQVDDFFTEKMLYKAETRSRYVRSAHRAHHHRPDLTSPPHALARSDLTLDQRVRRAPCSSASGVRADLGAMVAGGLRMCVHRGAPTPACVPCSKSKLPPLCPSSGQAALAPVCWARASLVVVGFAGEARAQEPRGQRAAPAGHDRRVHRGTRGLLRLLRLRALLQLVHAARRRLRSSHAQHAAGRARSVAPVTGADTRCREGSGTTRKRTKKVGACWRACQTCM